MQDRKSPTREDLPAPEKDLQPDPMLRPNHRRRFMWIVVLAALAVVIVTLIVVTSNRQTAQQTSPAPAAGRP